MTHGESKKVQKTSGNSDMTFSAGKSEPEFPEEVVENIISRIPFPSLFKARVLSRTWSLKLSATPQSGEPLSCLIQTLVSSVSSEWATYCPCYMSHEGILGFDRASGQWKTLMSISYLPSLPWYSRKYWFSLSNAGPLLCVLDLRTFSNFKGSSLFVTNALTRSWRQLNFPTKYDLPPVVKIILQGSDAYKVLVVSQAYDNFERDFERDGSFEISVYDSRTRTYKNSVAVGVSPTHIHRAASVYLDGKLYCMFNDRAASCNVRLGIYNVENNAWSTITNSNFDDFNSERLSCGVLLCGDKIMVVVCDAVTVLEPCEDLEDPIRNRLLPNFSRSLHIYELDVVALELKLVLSEPSPIIDGVRLLDLALNFSSDSNFIYFGDIYSSTRIFSYNIRSDEWDRLEPRLEPSTMCRKSMIMRWMPVAFQPGLCPYIMV